MQSVASLDRFILKENAESSEVDCAGGVRSELVNPYCFSFDLDLQEDGSDEAFSCYALTQRAMTFWKDSVIASIPQKIDEVTKTSSAVFTESIAEIRAGSAGVSTFDRVRTQSLMKVPLEEERGSS